VQAADGLHDLDYGDNVGVGVTDGVPWRRLVDHTRTIYRHNDLSGPLPPGTIESLALPLTRQKLALPDARAQALYVASSKLAAADLATALGEAGYVHSNGDVDWWLQSRQVFYSPTDEDAPAAELAFALQHFFLGHRYRDPFGKISYVTYDPYKLLPQQTADPLGNTVTAGVRAIDGSLARQGNDYRVMRPVLVTDPNRNRAAVAMNALGQVVATAVMGKSEAPLGDIVDDIDPDPPEALVQHHLTSPLADPSTLLGNATRRLLIDNLAFARTGTLPVVRYELARDTHVANVDDGQTTGITHDFTYFDGVGREIQRKTQAPPDPPSTVHRTGGSSAAGPSMTTRVPWCAATSRSSTCHRLLCSASWPESAQSRSTIRWAGCSAYSTPTTRGRRYTGTRGAASCGTSTTPC